MKAMKRKKILHNIFISCNALWLPFFILCILQSVEGKRTR